MQPSSMQATAKKSSRNEDHDTEDDMYTEDGEGFGEVPDHFAADF
jgi:hypothetical protein